MQQPLQITLRGMDNSEAVEARVRELAAALERFSNTITTCHVTLQTPHRHHHQGQLFDVRIRIGVPGSEIIVNREHPNDHAHEDMYVALRDAFAVATRKLEDYVRKHDHRARTHEPTTTEGKVARLFPQDGFGFIETSDGLDVYFHEHSVLGSGFSKLEVGDQVQLQISDQESDKGPQATTVYPRSS